MTSECMIYANQNVDNLRIILTVCRMNAMLKVFVSSVLKYLCSIRLVLYYTRSNVSLYK